MSFIAQLRRHHLLKGTLKVEGRNLVIRRGGQQAFQGGEKNRITVTAIGFTQHGAQHVDKPGAAAVQHSLIGIGKLRRRKPMAQRDGAGVGDDSVSRFAQ